MPKKDEFFEKAFEVLAQEGIPTEQQQDRMLNRILMKCKAENTSGIGKIINMVVTYPWRFAFIASAVQAVVVAFTEVFFYIFWNNTIWGMLLNIVFVGILIWKVILYFIYLKNFANLKGWRFIAACAAMGVIILILAVLYGYAGLKTPIL